MIGHQKVSLYDKGVGFDYGLPVLFLHDPGQGVKSAGTSISSLSTVMLNTRSKIHTHYGLKKMYLFGCG